ncbi:type VI secretion system tip protein VgrG [Variovorax paradoxus]|nr:type VI secretion system tip protein VgrG [Variovorax paradoxus]
MADNEFHIKSESPANGDLMFWAIVGYESFSRPSAYELRVLSKNDAIDPKKILGHAFDLVMEFVDADGNKHERHAQGHAVRFVRAAPIGRYFQYHITLRSWFWLLSKRTNSRIFQEKSVLEVLDAVFEDSPIKRFKKTKTDHVIGAHKKRRYCVQHQESDYEFLSRLLEDEGIYYWFDTHDAPGTMHLSDNSIVAHDKLPVVDTLRAWEELGSAESRYNELQYFFATHTADSGKFASRDSDFKAIKTKLVGDKSDPDAHELADLEVFEYPGGYFSGDDSNEIAKIRMEELAARRQLFHGKTGWPDVAAGFCFAYVGEGQAPNADYLISGCAVFAAHPGYEGMDRNSHDLDEQDSLRKALKILAQGDPINAGGTDLFDELIDDAVFLPSVRGTGSFALTTIPADSPFRPQRVARRVTMPGPQTAIVVGPEGEEIFADRFGRVKVQFHWDRYGKEDEDTTCWVRVSQPWAGKGWGGYFAPRIGQEVIVDFLNGDPDRPVIVGRVYDDDQPIPFKSHTQSGFRTRSTPKGNASNFNEFRFDDEKGKEQVFLHAEKNLDSEVESDETRDVGHNRTTHIHNDEKLVVDANRHMHVKVNSTVIVGADEDRHVNGNATEDINGSEDRTVGAGFKETITGGAVKEINGGETRTVNDFINETVNGNDSRTISGMKDESIGGDLSVGVAGSATIATGGAITLNAAGGLNIIAPGGTKVVDFQFLQFGGDEKVGYATSLNFSLINTEINALKGEATDFSNGVMVVKFEKVGLQNEQAATAIKQVAADIRSGASKIVSAGINLFL